MKVRIYTDEEIEELKKNIFVRDIKYKRQISYDPLFKLWTIMMRFEHPELSAREIFSRAGFNVNILHPSLPRRRINEWVGFYNIYGIKYFLPENESYSTIRKVIEVNNPVTNDPMKLQLMNYVLGKLKERYNGDR